LKLAWVPSKRSNFFTFFTFISPKCWRNKLLIVYLLIRYSLEMKRNRLVSIAFIISTLIIGLASRKFPQLFHPFFAEYLGDTLWAMLIFWLLGFVFIRESPFRLALAALLFSYLIEISQLYHAVWIDSIRETTMGALVLGHGFLWTDILCYSIGVGIGYLIELFLIKKENG